MLAHVTDLSDKVDQFSDKGDWSGMHHWMGGFGPGGSVPSVGILLWLATWVLVVMVLIALFRWLWKKGK